MLVDSHCHLDCIDLSEFNEDFDQLIQQMQKAGVEHMLCVSINLKKYPHMLETVRPYNCISVSAGVHPMADRTDDYSIDILSELAGDDKVVAIGETGLDYYYHREEKDWQQQQFREHMQVAKQHKKPVIVHTRDAASDTLEILREENVSDCGGVIHCFTEDEDFARSAMDMDMMISFSGIVTFSNAARLRQVAATVPDDYLLIETDAPYLAPVPHRGQQNLPAYVSEVAKALAEVRNTTAEHIAEVSRENFYRLFRRKN